MKRSSLRCPIPSEMRDQLADDPFMHRCIIASMCEGRIEWNHAFSYGGKRQNELWAILPMCHYHHEHEASQRGLINWAMRKRIKHFSAENKFKEKYPKSTLV